MDSPHPLTLDSVSGPQTSVYRVTLERTYIYVSSAWTPSGRLNTRQSILLTRWLLHATVLS